jgi:hypothetical protein
MFGADAVADPATGLVAAAAVAERLAAGGSWLLDIALARVAAALAAPAPARPAGVPTMPRARPVTRRAAPLGTDTERVLAQMVHQ